jgi:hypothetical protein
VAQESEPGRTSTIRRRMVMRRKNPADDILINSYTESQDDLLGNASFHVHFMPTYGSWINLVERWFAELTNKRIRRGVFRSVKELEAVIREYIDVHNEDPKPFVWTRTADRILDSIARYAQRTIVAQPSQLTSRTTGTGD